MVFVLADTDVRLLAARMLTSVVRDGKSLSELLPSAQLELEAQHAALLQELTYGVCRNYAKLDAIVDQLLKKSLRNKDTDVRMLLWLALYEIEFMSKPDYAVTSSYVDLTKKIKKPWAKALINGSLRQFLRNQESLTDNATLKNPHSLPEWLQKSINKDWPEQANSVFEAFSARAPLTLRANTTVTTREKICQIFKEADIQTEPCEHVDSGFRVIDGPPVTALPGFSEGEFSVQDQSAQLAAFLVNPQPGERVLDACAAPGGKSCHLLELQPSIQLTCLDNNAERLKRVEQNLQRLNLQANVVTGDAAEPGTWWDESPFDAVLLDAPCSALGALRRHPDIRLLRRESDIKALGKQQIGLLRSLWPLLKPGGRLIYATCSVLKQENEKCMDKFLAETPNAIETPIDAKWGTAGSHGRQILPGEDQADGFYYAILHKQ